MNAKFTYELGINVLDILIIRKSETLATTISRKRTDNGVIFIGICSHLKIGNVIQVGQS